MKDILTIVLKEGNDETKRESMRISLKMKCYLKVVVAANLK